jgi:hypothetical protein
MRSERLKTQVVALLLIALFSITGCVTYAVKETPPESPVWLYDSLIFEIAPIKNVTPSQPALEHLRREIHNHGIAHRSNIVFLTRKTEHRVPPGNLWSMQLIHEYERSHRLPLQKKTIFIAYIDGPILLGNPLPSFLGGIQYTNRSFAIFKQGAKTREGAVLFHEFLHMIGLLKNRRVHHCPNVHCVMHKFIKNAYSTLCEDCVWALNRLIRKGQRQYF